MKNSKIKKEIYNLLIKANLISGKEEWSTFDFDKSNITIFSNKRQTIYTKEIRICIKPYTIGDKMRKKYDVMRWKKKEHSGKIVYNLKEKQFNDEMKDIINSKG